MLSTLHTTLMQLITNLQRQMTLMKKYLLSCVAGSLANTRSVKHLAIPFGQGPTGATAAVFWQAMMKCFALPTLLVWLSLPLSAQVLFNTPGNHTYSVTSSGDLTLALQGADGGNGAVNSKGGAGARIRATFPVVAGDQLTIVVGGVGQTNNGGGGGGGSAVILNRGAAQTLLIVAGGGGGAGFNFATNPATPINGGGGVSSDGTAGGGANGGGASGGSGGGGFNAAGQDNSLNIANGGAAGTLSGGGAGGGGRTSVGGDGGYGFGGGGESTQTSGGGGGGYGGGEGGDGAINTKPSGGGSSFVGATATNVVRTSGTTGGGTQSNGFVQVVTRWHVNAAVGASGDGTSWATAFKTLREAIEAAGPGHEIWVAAGTYYPDEGPGVTDNDRNASFVMKNGVAVYGGFPSTGNPGLTDRNWQANPTILSGDIDKDGVVNATNSYNVVRYGNAIDNALLDGFVVTAGVTTGAAGFPFSNGGGVLIDGRSGQSSPRLVNCRFTLNEAQDGGAVYVYGDNGSCQPVFTNCSFVGNKAIHNRAGSSGGGLSTQGNCRVTVTNCTFFNNSSSGFGGAISLAFNLGVPNVTLKNCILWGNTAAVSGSQINNFFSVTNLSHTILQGGFGDIAPFNSSAGTNNDNGNNGTVDPLFVNSAGGDLRLQACSPAIDAGDNSANSTTTDLAGVSRQVRTIDIGAYEFQGTPNQPVAITNAPPAGATVCAGSPVEVTVDVSGTTGTFEWYRGNQLVPGQTTATLTLGAVTEADAGSYTLKVIGACNTLTTDTYVLSVKPQPTASILTNNGPICAGQTASFTLSGTSGATLTYTLTGQSGSQTLALTGGSQTIPVNNATSDVTLTLVSVELNGCTQNQSGSSTVSVKPLPTASISTNNGPICAGQSASFTLSGTSGGTLTYTLTGQSGSQTLALTGGSQTIPVNNATSDVTLTLVSVELNGCTQNLSGSSTVSVKPLPTASISTNNGPICAGQSASFTLSGTSGGTLTYTLTGQSGSQTLALTGGSQTIPVNNATSDVTLTLVSVELNGCTQSLSGSSTVSVKPQPTASISTNNGPICAGGNATFTLSGTGGATLTYTITGQAGNQTLALTGGSQTIPVNNATADVTLTLVSVELNGCTQSLSGSSTVSVKPLPTASISTNNGPICADQNATFTLSGTSGATLTYTLTGQSGNQTLALTGGSQTIPVNNATSDVTLTLVSVELNGCTQNLSGSSTVIVKPQPTASISTNNGPICAGQSASFTLSGTSGGTLTYTLTGQSGNQTLALTGGSQMIPVNNATSDVTLTLVSVELNGCTQSLSGSSTVSVKPLPTASISTNNGPICADQNATFTLSGTSGATLTYTLTGQSGNQTLALTGGSQTIPVNNATSDVTLTLVSVELNGCTQNLSGSSTVIVKPQPTASISTNNGPICAGQSASFTLSGTSGGTLTYTLTGQSGSQTLALTGGSQTIPVNNATSDVTLTLVSVELNGCTQNLSGSSTVIVKPLPTASISTNNGPICAGQSASFTLSGTSGATLTYTLTGQAGNQTLALTGSSQTIPVNNATADVTLTLVSVELNGCPQSLSGSSTVSVKPQPTASISTNNGPICVGQSASFTLSGTSGATLTYTLTGQAGNQTLALTGSSQTVTASNATADVTLTLVSVALNGCTASLSGSSRVTVNALPTLTPGPNRLVILGYGSNCTTLSATAQGTGPLSYAWSQGAGSTASVNVCPQATTTYIVTTTDARGCTSAPASVTVSVQDVRCGNQGQNVTICYYGVTQCVNQKTAERYLKLGARLGACGSGVAARIGYEEVRSDAPLSLGLGAYPNPVVDAVRVELLAPQAGPATLEVVDMTGRVRQSRQEPLVEGLNEVELRLGGLPTGVYLIKAVDVAGRQATVRVIKE
jgi:hypothetical protein